MKTFEELNKQVGIFLDEIGSFNRALYSNQGLSLYEQRLFDSISNNLSHSFDRDNSETSYSIFQTEHLIRILNYLEDSFYISNSNSRVQRIITKGLDIILEQFHYPPLKDLNDSKELVKTIPSDSSKVDLFDLIIAFQNAFKYFTRKLDELNQEALKARQLNK